MKTNDPAPLFTERIAFHLFLTLLFFSPLAFGTVETWSCLIMEAMICISLLLLILSARGKTFRRTPGLLPLLLFIAFLFVQILPLPPGLVVWVSPGTHSLHAPYAGMTGEAGWLPLSVHPRATLMELLRFSAYILFYITAIQLCSNGRLLKQTVSAVAGFAAVLALVAVIEFITRRFGYPVSHDRLLWIRELRYGGEPMGPYVNRNHYAGIMGMIFPLVLAIFLAFRPVVTTISFKKKIADFFNHKRFHRHFLYGASAILIATSILLSLSRGGILSLSLSMILFSVLIVWQTRQKKAGIWIGVVVAMVLFITGTSRLDDMYRRFEKIRNRPLIEDNRYIVWKDSLNIIRNFPLTGVGVGAFENIYPRYRTLSGDDLLEHAHNDYLEFLSTGGIMAPVLMGWSLFAILSSATRSFRKRRDPYSRLLYIGCITAITSILLHSMVDFNIQVGANGLYFFLILSLAVSSANTRMRYGTNETYLEESGASLSFIGAATVVLLTAIVLVHGGALIAHQRFSPHRNVVMTSGLPLERIHAIHQAAKASAAFDRWNPRYANITATSATLLGDEATAREYHARTLRLAQGDSRYLADAASFLRQSGDPDGAERLFRAAIVSDKTNTTAYMGLAAMHFKTNRTENGFDVLKQAISADTRITHDCLALMVMHGIEEDRMFRALPDRVEPYLMLGDFFNSLGEEQKAEAVYATALEFVSNEMMVEQKWFSHIVRFYLRNHLDEKALGVVQKAIGHFPEDHGLRRTAGDLYQKMGVDFRADEEYRKADILKNTHLR